MLLIVKNNKYILNIENIMWFKNISKLKIAYKKSIKPIHFYDNKKFSIIKDEWLISENLSNDI